LSDMAEKSHVGEPPAKRRKICHDKASLSRMQWLLGGAENLEKLWKETWGKHFLHVARKDPTFYSKVFKDFDIEDVIKIVEDKHLQWGTHLTARKTVDGIRYNMSPEGGPASGKQISFLYNDGSTIQFHQPQQHIPELAAVIRDLEETFGAVVGVNTYLTPPNAQGLAPHSDDICAFALQTHGEKTWCLHELAENDRLPIVESRDMMPDDLPPKSGEVT